MVSSLYIANAQLLRADAGPALTAGGVLVEGDRIAAVASTPAEAAEARARAREFFDADGMVLMPGLVNAHYHSYSTVLKGTQNSLPLEPWALYTVAYGRALGEEGVRLAVLLGAAEMIRNGITACLDHFPHTRWAEAALAAHEASGMRVGFAPFMHDVFDHEFLKIEVPPAIRARLDRGARSDPRDAERLYRDLAGRWHGRAGRLAIMLGPSAFQRCSERLVALWRGLSDELGLATHTHLLETRAQAAGGAAVWSGATVGEMARRGLLSNRLSVAHGLWLTADETDLLARHGVTLVHNPASNLMLGSGRLVLPRLLQRGVPVALGTDSSNTGGPHSLFEVMRLALMLSRPDTPDPRAWPTANQIFAMATSGGARALGLGQAFGRLERGQRADMVLLTTRTAALAGAPITLPHLVQHASADAVKAVMINGEWVLREGRILAFDEAAVLDEVRALVPEILGRARAEVEFAETAAPYFCVSTGPR